MTPTHRFIAERTSDGDPSPFTGLELTMLKTFEKPLVSGNDGIALLHTNPFELARRHTEANDSGVKFTAADIPKMYPLDAWSGWGFKVDPGAFIIEVDTNDLEPME